MISEPQQEQASLYALGLLDEDAAHAFERELAADAEVRRFARELQESIALLALAGDRAMQKPPPALRERVLAQARAERAHAATVAAFRVPSWVPWSIAALLLGCAATLSWFAQAQGKKLNFLAGELNRNAHFASSETPAPTVPTDALAQISFCALEPTPDFTTAQPRAAVLWDAARRQGKLRVNRLAPPAEGKDYQLWTVETGRKAAVSAGVFHVGADGTADVPFQPAESGGKPVVAVAISLEQAGGSPTGANQGPILLVGKF